MMVENNVPQNGTSGTPENEGGESFGGGQSKAFPTREEHNALVLKQEKDQRLLLTIMSAIVIFVVVTFWIELTAMHRNYAEDKSLSRQNNELNKDYFDKVLFLDNKVDQLKLELETLKRQNYLK